MFQSSTVSYGEGNARLLSHLIAEIEPEMSGSVRFGANGQNTQRKELVAFGTGNVLETLQ